MISGDLELKIDKLQAGFAAARQAGQSYKAGAKADFAGFGADLFGKVASDAQGTVKSLGGNLLGALGVSGGLVGIFEAVKGATGSFKELDLLARKVGDSGTEGLQRLKPVAREAHVELDQVVSTLLRLEKSLGDPGNEELAATLARLGVRAGDLASMPVDRKILALSEAFQKARADGTGVHDLAQLLGKSFADLIPILAKNTDELREMMDAVKPVGDDMVDTFASINEAIESNEGAFDKWSKRSLASVAGVAQFIKRAFSVGVDRAYLSIGEDNQASGAEHAKREREKQEGARALQEKTDAAAAARIQAEADRAHEESARKIASLTEKISASEFALLPDFDKIEALSNELDGIYKRQYQAGGGVFFNQTTQGLRDWIEVLKTRNDDDGLQKALPLLERALEIEKQINQISDKTREEQARSDKERKDTLDRIHEEERRAERELMSPKQRIDAAREELRSIFDAANVNPDLTALKKAAQDAEKSGSLEDAKTANTRYLRALEISKDIPKGPQRNVLGSYAQDLNVLSGRGVNEGLLQNSDKTVRSLDEINQGIKALLEKDPVVIDTTPRFGFPGS